MKTTIGSVVLFTLLFSSCSFEKRIYTNGFYIDRNEHNENTFRENNFHVSKTKSSSSLINSHAEFKNVKRNGNEKLICDSVIFYTSESKISEVKRSPFQFGKSKFHQNCFPSNDLYLPEPPDEKQKLSDQAQTVLGAGLFAFIGVLIMFMVVFSTGMWVWFGIAFFFIAPIACLVGMILGIIVLSKLKLATDFFPHDKAKAKIGLVLSFLGTFLLFAWLMENGDWLSANF